MRTSSSPAYLPLSLCTMMIFFCSKREDCFVWPDCMGCVSLHVCVCVGAVVVVVYFSYFETLQRIHFRWKFPQIEKPQHLNERWDVDFSPFYPVMMLQFVCVCVMCIDSNDDVLFFTLFDTLFTSYFNAWTEKFGFSVAALSRCCSPFLGVLFVSYELDHRNKPSYHRPVLRVTFALSLLFSFVRWYCCCLQFIYFFGVFVLFFGLPSIISGIN